MRAVYTRKEDNGVSLITGAPKDMIERDLSSTSDYAIQRNKDEGRLPLDVSRDPVTGKVTLSDSQYQQLVLMQAIHDETINLTVLEDGFELPSMEFFDAWTHDGKEFGHDLEKAKAIQLDRIRAARTAKFAPLDIEFMQALEKGDTAASAAVVAQKDTLRKITDSLKALTPTSIDDVIAAFPSELK